MSNPLRKRRQTASETAVGPSSCANPGCHCIPNLTISNSKETADYRWNKNASRHRKGVCRRLSAPRIMFGRHRCPYQTPPRASLSNRVSTLLTGLFQQCKDIEDKVGDLVPWLVKLKDSVMTTSADGDNEEGNWRGRLIWCVPHCRYLVNPLQPSVGTWNASIDGLRNCWRKGSRSRSSMECEIRKQ